MIMKKTAALLSILIAFTLSLYSQEDEQKEYYRPIQFFIGIQPTADLEPFDGTRYTTFLNIIPVQLEYAINDKWSVRLTPQAIMQFVPELPAEISKVGAGLTFPYHFAKKNSEEGHRGFYAGPSIGMMNHKVDNFVSASAAAEIGYCFLFNSVFSLNLGVQAGKVIQFDPNGGYAQIYNHTGAVFAFGIWF